jgi:hypothetical protein
MVNPATIALLAIFAKFPDDIPPSPGQEIRIRKFKQYNIPIVCISVHLFHNQRLVADPSDLGNNAVVTGVSMIPVEGNDIILYGASHARIVR